MSTQLGIFAKHWQPGAVKTRLGASIGDAAAAKLHHHFVQTLLHRFWNVAEHQVLCFTPLDSEKSFRELDLRRWTLEPQSTGDLGTRMEYYFSAALSSHDSPRVILIGSDSPDLPREYLEEALEMLREVPVVLGPTADGGYYLLGLSQKVPPIFEKIPWSTAEVWPHTVARLTAAQIPYHVLPEWYDVDDDHGLNSLLLHVNSEGYMDSHLRELERAIFDVLRQP